MLQDRFRKLEKELKEVQKERDLLLKNEEKKYRTLQIIDSDEENISPKNKNKKSAKKKETKKLYDTDSNTEDEEIDEINTIHKFVSDLLTSDI